MRDASVRALGRIGRERRLPGELISTPTTPSPRGSCTRRSPPLDQPRLQSSARSPLARRPSAFSSFGVASALDADDARPLLAEKLRDRRPTVRAAGGTRRPARGTAIPGARPRRRRPRTQRPAAAVAALGSVDDPRAIELLVGALADPDRLDYRPGRRFARPAQPPSPRGRGHARDDRADGCAAGRAREDPGLFEDDVSNVLVTVIALVSLAIFIVFPIHNLIDFRDYRAVVVRRYADQGGARRPVPPPPRPAVSPWHHRHRLRLQRASGDRRERPLAAGRLITTRSRS